MGKCISTNKPRFNQDAMNHSFKPERLPKHANNSQQENAEVNKHSEGRRVTSSPSKQGTPRKLNRHEHRETQVQEGNQEPQLELPSIMMMPRALKDTHFLKHEDQEERARHISEYEKKPLFPDEFKAPLIDACVTGNFEVVKEFLENYKVVVNDITGKMEQVHVGNRTIQSENLNILHLAVYHNHTEIVLFICESVPNLDIAYAGRIPSSSGLANESEISLSDYDNSARPNFLQRSSNLSVEQVSELKKYETPRVQPSIKVRSLILFWALDKGNLPLLRYLWQFDRFKTINWGLKNLEFMLLLANDLFEPEVFEILLSPKPFAVILSTLSFHQAMDFIEDHIINNNQIQQDLKLKLLYSDEMAPYSFIGALHHLSIDPEEDEDFDQPQPEVSQFDKEEDECEIDIEIEELLDIYHKLNQQDLKTIVRNQDVMTRFNDIILGIDKSKKLSASHKDKIKQMVAFVLHFKKQLQEITAQQQQ